MKAPKDWWTQEHSDKPGPARIRVTFSRSLTEAEKEHLYQLGQLIREKNGDRLRLNGDGRLYAESASATSRQLFDAITELLAHSFVNVFPTAVRTFRERVGVQNAKQPEAKKKEQAGKSKPIPIPPYVVQSDISTDYWESVRDEVRTQLKTLANEQRLKVDWRGP